MEFIEGLLVFDGKDKILVVVDKLTKYAHFIGMKKSNLVKPIAEIFCKNVYKLYGFPKVIVSDRDAKFKGDFWKEFFQSYRNLPQHEFNLPSSNRWPNKGCQ